MRQYAGKHKRAGQWSYGTDEFEYIFNPMTADPDISATKDRPANSGSRQKPAARKTISRTIVNFWLDASLLILFTVLSWVTVVLRFVFPPGPDSEGWTLWGRTYVQWVGFQFVVLAAFSLGVLVHVMLHWPWVCGVVQSRLVKKKGGGKMDDGSRTLWGVATLIVIFNIIGLAIAVAVLTIQPPVAP